jgi:DNA-binding NarL/FixJ family response regulator
MITILLVDDQAAARMGLKLRFGLETDLLVLGEAIDGEDAVAQATRLVPDVVVMDVAMPNMDGIEATREICASCDCKVVVLSLYDDSETRKRAAEAGACAFVTKQEADAALLMAVRTAGRGGAEARRREVGPGDA